MNEELQMVLDETKENMEKSVKHFGELLSRIHAGKANPQMVNGIYIDYYGTRTPLPQAASINTPDPKTIVIQPWDKTILEVIEKAIQAANLGFNPMNNGEIIRINVPPLTEERRRQIVKNISGDAENNRVAIRNIRKRANEDIKFLQKEGVSEDEAKKAEDNVQELTNKYIKQIDENLKRKEQEIMTV